MNEQVGMRIKERRKALNMKQETLAKASKVSRARISAIENGKCSNVMMSTLSAIASALGTTVDFFLG